MTADQSVVSPCTDQSDEADENLLELTSLAPTARRAQGWGGSARQLENKGMLSSEGLIAPAVPAKITVV